MTAMLLDLLRAARGAGVRISVAESIDAFRSAEVVGYTDRQTLKDTLSLTLGKSIEDKKLFEDTFDLYFQREMVSSGEAEAPASPRQPSADGAPDGLAPLSSMLLDNDQAGLAGRQSQLQ